MSSQSLHRLQSTVQQNCHIADSAHAADYTLCIYLLKMREYYRWEMKQGFATNLDNRAVGHWLKQREAYWEDVEDQEFATLEWQGKRYSPFESEQLNPQLREHGLVYSAGLGINNRPHFYLASLERHETHHGYELHVSAEEYARDLPSPPAMSQGKHIFIRKEALKRMLWERLETWRWNKPDNAMGRAFACYACDDELDHALDAMTEHELENVLSHEMGEIEAGQLLGEEWESLLLSLPHSKASLMLRAVRDYLADAMRTIPLLLEKSDAPAMHFYFGNLSNMRKELSPSLLQAYEAWYRDNDISKLHHWIEHARGHWSDLAHDCLAIYRENNQQCAKSIIDLIESRRL